MTKAKEPNLPKILDDLPAEVDSFNHERVAHAIAGLIRDQDGGKAIALTGTWGSGKSTIVEFLRKELENNDPEFKETIVFEFDAWSHEGDPLRRVFLEELIKKVLTTKPKGLNKREWEDRSNKWHKIKKELGFVTKRTKSQPILRNLGLIFIAALLTSQIILTAFHLEGASRLLWALIFLPIILMFLIPGANLLLPHKVLFKARNLFDRRKRDDEDYLDEQSSYGFFINQHETIATATESNDQPSIKFEECFIELMDDFLRDFKERQLLIVIDNLDRIDPEEALNVWASMRIFADICKECKNDNSLDNWRNKLWVLVPFDPSAMKRLWPRQKKPWSILGSIVDIPDPQFSGPNDNRNLAIRADVNPQSQHEDLSSAFTEKTFQVTFHVPPPVLSKTHKYFADNFFKAFEDVTLPEINGKENLDDLVYKVYNVFMLEGKPLDRPITPRDIKIFINRIVAIYRQCRGDIYLPVQALYAANIPPGWQGEQQLRESDEDIIKHRTIEYIGEQWRTGLAAIHFAVPFKQALEVLYGQLIDSVLETGVIIDVKEYDPESFGLACSEILSDIFRVGMVRKPNKLAYATKLLNAFGEYNEIIENKGLKASWDTVFREVMSATPWEKVNADICEGIVVLLRNRTDLVFHKNVLESIANSLSDERQFGEEPTYTLDDWILGSSMVLSEVMSRHPGVIERFEFKGDSHKYLEVIKFLATSPIRDDVKCLYKPLNEEEVRTLFIRNIQNGSYDENLFSEIKLLIDIGVIHHE